MHDKTTYEKEGISSVSNSIKEQSLKVQKQRRRDKLACRVLLIGSIIAVALMLLATWYSVHETLK